MTDPISIAGLGVVSPFGDSPAGFRDALLDGATAIAADPRFVSFGCRSRLAARVSGFDPARWVAPMKLRRMDTTGPYALAAVRQAMEGAKYPVTTEGDARAGIVLGTYSAGGQATNEYLESLFRGGPSGAPALLFNSTVGNAAAGLAGLEYKLCGPNATISQKEASGLAAIATAVDLLRLGRADAVGAGGMDAIYDIFYRAHDRFDVMSDAPAFDDSLAPFSRSRRGFVMGEGGFVLWLTREARAIGATARSSAPLRRARTARSMPGPRIRSRSSARCRSRSRTPGCVRRTSMWCMHRPMRPPAWMRSKHVRSVALFGGSRTIVTSIKGAIGECGASGAAACVAAVLCGAAGRVPPIAGLRDADPIARPLRLADANAQAPGEIVLVNSVASGGAVVSAVLRIPASRSR